MPPDVRAVPRPDWSPLPFDGCDGVDGKVLLQTPRITIAMLRFRSQATIHEHPAPFAVDVICLEGQGRTSVSGETAAIRAGERVHWPANEPHRLWTEEDEMITLMVEHHRELSG